MVYVNKYRQTEPEQQYTTFLINSFPENDDIRPGS